MADLSRSAGISQPTVKTWINLLEAAYIIRLLPPNFGNFGKRIVKSPKLYFLDSALVSALTRQPAAEAALAGAMGGVLFEGFVVSEAYKVFAIMGKRPDLFFWRSQGGLKVDLLLSLPTGLVPVEVKLTSTPTLKHAEVLGRFKELAGPRAAGPGLLVCNIPEPVNLPGGNLALPWRQFPEWLRERLGTTE